ncbi:hypothetical protein IKQ21_07260 [bacterium]|nr:hypothetical protein [bacterium]
MKVSSINETNARRNAFIAYANSFMSTPSMDSDEIVEKASDIDKENKSKGLETLETFTIFPKQVVNGKTIITA